MNSCPNLYPFESYDLEKPFNLPFLECLKINQANISTPELQTLLANASFLKKIDLEDNLVENGLAGKLSFPALEHLNLFGTTISHLALHHLLTHSPALKSLFLNLQETNIPIEGLKLPLLEELQLENCNIHWKTVHQILN